MPRSRWPLVATLATMTVAFAAGPAHASPKKSTIGDDQAACVTLEHPLTGKTIVSDSYTARELQGERGLIPYPNFKVIAEPGAPIQIIVWLQERGLHQPESRSHQGGAVQDLKLYPSLEGGRREAIQASGMVHLPTSSSGSTRWWAKTTLTDAQARQFAAEGVRGYEFTTSSGQELTLVLNDNARARSQALFDCILREKP